MNERYVMGAHRYFERWIYDVGKQLEPWGVLSANAQCGVCAGLPPLGRWVTIVENGPRLIDCEDANLSKAVADILRNEGTSLGLNAERIRFTPTSWPLPSRL